MVSARCIAATVGISCFGIKIGRGSGIVDKRMKSAFHWCDGIHKNAEALSW